MSRHNPVASRRRRLPYLAKIKRDDAFRREDEREIEAMCNRIAAAGDYLALAGERMRAIACSTSGRGQRRAPSTTGDRRYASRGQASRKDQSANGSVRHRPSRAANEACRNAQCALISCQAHQSTTLSIPSTQCRSPIR